MNPSHARPNILKRTTDGAAGSDSDGYQDFASFLLKVEEMEKRIQAYNERLNEIEYGLTELYTDESNHPESDDECGSDVE